MAQSSWEADKMLDVYIYDYLLKRKLHESAKAFMTEGKVAADPVAIDAPGGFLFEWWSVFWDIFIARTNDKHSEAAAAYIETQQLKAREHQQQMHLQQLQLLQQQRNGQLQRRDPSHPPLSGSITAMNSEGMMGQPPTNLFAMKMYEERMKEPHSMDTDASPALMDANRMALLKSSANPQGTMVQGNSGGLPTALQQIQARSQMTPDIKSEVNLSATQKSLPMDPSSIYGQAFLQSKSGLGGAGLNQGVTGPLKGWPLTGIDPLRPSLGVQVQKPGLQTQNQFIFASQQQQAIAAGQGQGAQGITGSSSNYGDVDPRRLCLPRSGVNTKNGQSTRNDGSICSPVQSNSPRMKLGQMPQSSSQQDQLQQQQLQQNNRKRKTHSSSGAANSNGTGNTMGLSPSSPPSTHTPGDGLNHVNSMSKGLMMYPEGTGGLGPSTNLLDDMEQFGDVGSFDDNVESFLSNDAGDGRDLYGSLKQSPTEPKKEPSRAFTFEEFGCIRTKNSKVTCCHFSSDGKLLASAGHDKKAVLWNMETLQTESMAEEHQHVITDIRFRPNSSQLMTASYDASVRLWDASKPSYSLHAYTTHHAPVMSVDFHPKKTDLFCFCDDTNEIRYWNINPFSCTRISKGGAAQVRFQPRNGQYLAVASGEAVSIFDVETDTQTHSFQGHGKQVNYVCWDEMGNLVASVSQDSVKVWSLSSRECIHELTSPATDIYSCVFHPRYSTLLVIGGASSVELWNTMENKRMTVAAHENIIAALAQSAVNGMVASASHDSSVKLWK